MIRLLIIGRDAEQWRQRLTGWSGQTIEVVTETLPAAGIRNFSEVSPDAVAISAEGSGSAPGANVRPVVEAIRERPLGQIAPVVVLGVSRIDDEDLQVAAAIGPKAGGEALARELGSILEVDLEPDSEPRHAQATAEPDLEVGRTENRGDDGPTFVSTEIPLAPGEESDLERSPSRGGRPARREAPDHPSSDETIDRQGYVIEPLDDEQAADEMNPSAGGAGARQKDPSGELQAAEIRRKVKEVRHEDYFVILDVSRSVEDDEVRQAYRTLKSRFRPDNVGIQLAENFEAELDEINDALDDARAVLGEASLREAYRDRTTRG